LSRIVGASFPPPLLTHRLHRQKTAKELRSHNKEPIREPYARVRPKFKASPEIVCQTAFQGICFLPFPYTLSLPPGFWSDLLRTTSKRNSVVNIAVIGPPECGKSTFIRKAVKNLHPQALPPIRRRGYSSETSLFIYLYRFTDSEFLAFPLRPQTP
jgi:hypothetical protein